jgi:hypothetical protein
MSKSKHTKYRDNDYNDDDEISFSKAREEIKNRRKQKRIKAALRTKNIDDLIKYEYDEDKI